MELLDCGHPESEHLSITRGYGQDRDGKKYCYDCCADNERQAMLDTGRATLYLVKDNGHYEVTDWPGKLRFKVYYKHVGRHNIAGNRIDVWFDGPDGHVWHGVQYGDWTDICHCKSTKEITLQ